MSLNSVKQIIENGYEAGQHWFQPFRKVFPLTTTAGFVHDLSMGSGNPRPNYYTGDPKESKALTSAFGIWSGGDVSPATKVLHQIQLYTTTAAFINCNFTLCDYLLFYPLIDGDDLSEPQALTTPIPLPRYSTGDGVKAMLVATNPYTGNVGFYITYTNQNGESGRTSKINWVNANGAIGCLVTSQINTSVWGQGPFIQLQEPSDGIRSVEGITFLGAASGLYSLVLVKPLAEVYGREVLAPSEWDMLLDCGGKLPRIYDGSYLNFIARPNGNISGAYIQGSITTIWN